MEAYLASQPDRDRAKIEARMVLLAEEGPMLRRPFADVVEGKIRELRIGRGRLEHRILYYFVKGDSVVLLHAFLKKKQKLLRRELDLARSRMREVDRRLAAGEVLE